MRLVVHTDNIEFGSNQLLYVSNHLNMKCDIPPNCFIHVFNLFFCQIFSIIIIQVIICILVDEIEDKFAFYYRQLPIKNHEKKFFNYF